MSAPGCCRESPRADDPRRRRSPLKLEENVLGADFHVEFVQRYFDTMFHPNSLPSGPCYVKGFGVLLLAFFVVQEFTALRPHRGVTFDEHLDQEVGVPLST